MKLKAHIFCVLFLSNLLAVSAATADPVLNFKVMCDDPFVIRDHPTISAWDESLRAKFLASEEVVYAEIRKSDIESGNIKTGDAVVSNQRSLSSAEAQLLSSILERRVEAIQIPWYTSYLVPPIEFVSIAIVKKGLEALPRFLVNKSKNRAISEKALLAFIAKGGSIVGTNILSKLESDYVITHNIEYSVSVGDEQRHFLLASCNFPVKVIPARITVNYVSGSYSYFEESGDGLWIEKEANGDIADKWLLSASDERFLYFEKIDTCTPLFKSEGLCVQYRIGKLGKPVDTKFSGDADWNIYSGVPLGISTKID